MVESFDKASDLIKPHLHEAVKTHYVYDGSARVIESYEAATSAVNGQACMRTRYQYDGITARITGTKEELTTWDETWDF